MKKIYATVLMALMAFAANAQEKDNSVTVTLDFNQNPWNHTVRQSTNKEEWGGTGRTPKGTAAYWDYDGSILTDKDFSWPMPEGSGTTEKIKVTLYAVDLDEYGNVSVYGNYLLNAAECASMFIEEGYKNILYTRPGTRMRFEAPAGFDLKKIVFYCYSSPNVLTGDGAYDEEYEYQYDGNTFTTTRKYWTPESPKHYKGESGGTPFDYSMWEGDAKNVLFNYIYFTANFVNIVITLAPDGSAGVNEVNANAEEGRGELINLGGQRVANGNSKGVYIVNGKKKLVK